MFMDVMKTGTSEYKSKDIFKVHYWFLLVSSIQNFHIRQLLFKFDSKIHLLVLDQNWTMLYEAYSIDGKKSIVRQIGTWKRNEREGKKKSLRVIKKVGILTFPKCV